MTVMATTTKSTRKTPTKTKKAVKTPAKTTKTAAKAVKKPAVKATQASIVSPLERLRTMNLGTAALYLLFAGLVIGFVKVAAVPVMLGLQTRDEFASQDHVVLSGASEVLYNVEPKYLLALSLIISALATLLFATKLRARYETTIAARVNGLRWIALGLSSAVLITYVNQLAGVTDFATLKLSGALIILTTLLAWFADRDNAGAARPKWLAFVASLFAGALAWLPVVGTFIGTSVYGMERFGWHVYAIAGVVLAGFTGFALNQYFQIRAKGGVRDYVNVEETYLRIDLFTKFAVVLITLLALK